MNTEIKFRGYSPGQKRWLVGNLLQSEPNNNGTTYCEIHVPMAHGCSGSFTSVLHNTVGQYTRFKDKNLKEIFKGDIVRCVAEPDYEEHSKVSDVIRNVSGEWQIRDTGKDYPHDYYQHGLPLNWGGWESIEVIGNTYENPELLA